MVDLQPETFQDRQPFAKPAVRVTCSIQLEVVVQHRVRRFRVPAKRRLSRSTVPSRSYLMMQYSDTKIAVSALNDRTSNLLLHRPVDRSRSVVR